MTHHPPGPVWLQGPISGVPDYLQHVAHALIECSNDVRELLSGMSRELVWTRPNGAASVGFHVRHSMGSLDRLCTYARGEPLDDAQLATLAAEKSMDARTASPEQLLSDFTTAIDRAIAQLRATPPASLLEHRDVGRGKLPSTVLGLLSHAGEHTYRHIGQAVTTARIVRMKEAQ